LASTAAATVLASLAAADEPSAPKEVPWLADVQRLPRQLPADAPKLSPLLVDADGRKISDLAGWNKRREQLRSAWNELLRPLKLQRSRPKLTVLEEDRPEGCVRQLVRYESEPGLPVEGYLLKPAKLSSRVPGVVAMHSTSKHTIRQPAGVEGEGEQAFGLKLAQRGVVAFCPRCFLWQGEGSYVDHVKAFQKRRPGSLGMAKMLWDAMRGVDVLASLDEVDAKRLGAIGHSLGGKEALYLAAFDERIKATVSSEGGIGVRFSNWHDVWYLGEGVKRPDFAREHHELLALVAPRAFLLLGGDSADGERSWPFITAALEAYGLYGEPRRVGLFNHRKGHAVPEEAQNRAYEWLLTYL
jgi:hypothetical protein